jgi:predicted TIM-barrel enzyme
MVVNAIFLYFTVNFQNIEIFVQFLDGAVIGLSLKAGLGVFSGV